MVYATEIINTSLERTKKLFFPIRAGYWLRMGLAELFGGRGAGGGNLGNYSYKGSSKDFGQQSFREILSKFNTEALTILSNYGYIIGIGFIIIYAIGLLFSYLHSVFTFVFLEGVVKGEIRIRKSFNNNKKLGLSLFFIYFLTGLITFAVLLLVLSPLIYSFSINGLSSFNLWLLIPMLLVFFAYSFFISIFLFLLHNFIIPIMYLKKISYLPAWAYFKKTSKGKVAEIVIYGLLKIALSIAAGIISLLLLIPVFIVFIIPLLVFAAIGVGIYFAVNTLTGMTPAIVITVVYAVSVISFFIYLITVVFVPIPAFFMIYSLEMLKKLEQK